MKISKKTNLMYKYKWGINFKLLGILIVQILFFKILFSSEKITQFIVNELTFPITSKIGDLTNKINFPIGEFFYLIIGLLLILMVFKIFYTVFKNKKKVPKIVFKLLLVITNIFYFIYMLAWGVMYKKETLTIDRESIVIDTEVLKKIYCKNLDKAIEARNTISNNDLDSSILKFNLAEEDYNNEFHRLQYKLKEEKWLKNYRFLKNGQFKLSNISLLQNYLGILGYYNPFTVESNLNRYNTDLKKSLTIFHEYGHQMGFASESEANFLAYYIGINSNNLEINYSAYYKSIFSLLNAIYKSDPYFVKAEMNNMNFKIKRDRIAEINYYKKYEGKTSDVFSELNNQFLKRNDQEGTISYGKYIELVYVLELGIKNKEAKSSF